MKFDFIEANPFVADLAGGYRYSLDGVLGCLQQCAHWEHEPGEVIRASSLEALVPDDSLDALITDPPYYDVVPYADCSDFFVVWLRRMTQGWSTAFPDPLSPKSAELVQLAERNERYSEKTKLWFEQMMRQGLTTTWIPPPWQGTKMRWVAASYAGPPSGSEPQIPLMAAFWERSD